MVSPHLSTFRMTYGCSHRVSFCLECGKELLLVMKQNKFGSWNTGCLILDHVSPVSLVSIVQMVVWLRSWVLKVMIDTGWVTSHTISSQYTHMSLTCHMSNEEPWYTGDYTTQLYRDYNTPLQGSLWNSQDSMESQSCFFIFRRSRPSNLSGMEWCDDLLYSCRSMEDDSANVTRCGQAKKGISKLAM